MRKDHLRDGHIKDLKLIDDENEMYICSNCEELPFNELVERIKSHFGEDTDFSEITIESEYIHTECLAYDRYDPGDYGSYLVIRRNKK